MSRSKTLWRIFLFLLKKKAGGTTDVYAMLVVIRADLVTKIKEYPRLSIPLFEEIDIPFEIGRIPEYFFSTEYLLCCCCA